MATITDSLLTVLRLVGGSQYAQQMRAAAASTQTLATAQAGATASATGLRLGTFAAMAEIGIGIGIIGSAIAAFGKEEEAIFSLTLALKNMGSSLKADDLVAYADGIRKTTSLSREAVISLLTQEQAAGVLKNSYQAVTKTIVDFSRGEHISLEEAGQAVLRGIEGRSRGLAKYHIQVQNTGDKLKNFAIIQQKIEGLFGGAGAAERDTLKGSIDALSNSVTALLETAGNRLANVLVPAIHLLTAAIDQLEQHPIIAAILTGGLGGAGIGAGIGALVGNPLLGALIGGGIGGAAGLLGGLLGPHQNPAEKVGTGKERLATEATLGKIAENTASLSPLIRAVLGGTGEVARRAFTYRDFAMSVKI